MISDNNYNTSEDKKDIPEIPLGNPDGTTEIVGVKFQNSGKVYSFSPLDLTLNIGDPVIVQTSRGQEYGTIVKEKQEVPTKSVVPPLRPVLRKATEEDTRRNEQNKAKEKDAFAVCLEKISLHKLDMKLIDAEYTFDGSKLVFYFSAEGRVDFRELVKDLASVFHTRIELRQIGIRDEAKLLGGLGICGLPFCCSTFLSDFAQVSIKMAKEQNLSLNSTKISGTCGRLMCCLRYESDAYEEGLRACPNIDAKVKTPEGVGVVTEINPLTRNCRVSITDSVGNECIKYFKAEDLIVLSREKRSKGTNEKNDRNETTEK